MKFSVGEGLLTKFLIVFMAMVSCSMVLTGGVVLAAHDNSAEISPEWSSAGIPIDYVVTICNVFDGNDSIDEVRLYETVGYTITNADDKTGWYKSAFNPIKKFYQYTADGSSNYIDAGECTDFTFTALTPEETPACDLEWKFETRDLNNVWKFAYDYTSVDKMEPSIEKEINGPQMGPCPPGEGQECWIRHSTEIAVTVNEEGACEPPSGLDWCEITYTIDGAGPYQEVYEDLNGEMSWEYSVYFDEDSLHVLNVTCKDIAGNILEDIEHFRVDDTPPISDKWFEGPQKFELGLYGMIEWIDGVTTVILDSYDPDPTNESCNIGVDKVWYLNVLAEEENPCWMPEEACHALIPSPYDTAEPGCIDLWQEVCIDFPIGQYENWEDCVEQNVHAHCGVDPRWHIWDRVSPIPKDEESCHIFQYFAIDHLGNIEEMNVNCFFVDKTPPEVVKFVDEPNILWSEIKEAADRIMDLQYTDGSWDWVVTNQAGPTGTTYLNIAGVTAEVLLDAYELTGELKYLDAAKKTGDYLISQIGDPVSASQRQNAFSMVFLYRLADITGDSQYSDQADAILNHVLHEENYWSNNNGNHCDDDSINGCTASELLDALKDFRSWAGNPNGIVVWDLFHFVEAAQIGGESAFATNMANVLDTYMSQSGFDNTIDYYVIGLSGGIIALDNAGLDYSTYLAVLLAEQNMDGSFGTMEPVQGTAYALMALEHVGDTSKTMEASYYLVNNFGYSIYDGWLESDGEEYSEVTSEAAHALYYVDSHEGAWVTSNTDIIFTCEDQMPHPSGDEKLCFKVSYDLETDGYLTDEYCIKYSGTMKDDWCCKSVNVQNPLIFNFNVNEDSFHDLEYYCTDAVQKNSSVHIQYYRVDDTPPYLVDKGIEGPFYAIEGVCPPTSEFDICHLDGVSHIFIEVVDGGEICAVDDVICEWKYRVDGGQGYGPYTDWVTYDEGCGGIHFPEESKHELVIRCTDKLGNSFEDVEVFYVDKTAPVTTKTYIGPQYPDPITEQTQYPHWIDTVTEIELTATDDVGPHDSGVKETYYRVTQVEDMFCEYEHDCEMYAEGSGDFVPYTGRFGLPESCHLIEYYSIDNVNKVELTKKQCVYSDHTKPVAYLADIVGPQIDCLPEENCYKWVADHRTDIYIDCMNDPDEPHPAPLDKLYWRIDIDGFGFGDWQSQDVNGPAVITFLEDSVHTLEYYCTDKVAKESDHQITVFRVDSIPPEITKIMHGPYFGPCPPTHNGIEYECYVDNATSVEIIATDPDPTGFGCAVGGVECRWRYSVNGGEWSDWEDTNIITFPEECFHDVEVECEDALGNTVSEIEKFIADHTPPIINKWYIGPEFYGDDSGYPKWITSETDVMMDVHDPEPHPSGVNEIRYRITLVGDEYCWDQTLCQEAEGLGDWTQFIDSTSTNINEESCHLIEIYAEDNVGKFSDHKQCVFVDNQGPDPVKTVGKPSTTWHPTEETILFYPEIVDKCWNEDPEISIDCWKVTMMTPITLNCSDPDPHPVGENEVCFKVELDAVDETEMYCLNYYNEGAVYDKYEDGYCCLEGPVDFNFGEETEHNLDYYCVDRLGNEGPHDDEKFKVEGTMFEIPLYKKWNLISVPFVLLDSAPLEVFEGLEGVDSVWTYDPEICTDPSGWCVWTPGPANDTLTSINPGWGYWVLEKNEESGEDGVAEWLTIGGSLFNTRELPPSRNLVDGWNLIGYYGTSWELYDWGDANFMCGDAFDLPDRYIYGDKVYCSLNSLIDTQEGFPRWSSLWSYINCGGHDAFWVGLNTCADQDSPLQMAMSRMYAGRGYWLELEGDDQYVPATTCIWNEDFECRMTGGGILP